MDPLQMQMLLKQLREKSTMGPDSDENPDNWIFTEFGQMRQPPVKKPTIGPAPNPGLTDGMAVPNEMGLVVERMMNRPATIGPAPTKTGLTSGLAVPNELGLDMTSPTLGAAPMGGGPAMPVFNDEDPANPAKPAAPPMLGPSPLEAIPAERAVDMQDTLGDSGFFGEQPEAPTSPAPETAAPKAGGRELPYQTFERLTGQKWSGGRSSAVQDIMSRLGITAVPGSAEANLALQKALMQNAAGIEG